MTGATRRQLLSGAALAPAALLLAPMTAAADAAGSLPARLQRLIRVELLLLFCYRHVLSSAVLGARARDMLEPFIAHEQAHIAALERALSARGAAPPPGPADVTQANRDLARRNVGGRLGQLKGDFDAVRLLLTLEQVTIGAYSIALQTLGDADLIELVCQIMANEAQHDAVLGLLVPPGKPASAVPYGLVQGLQGNG